MRRRGSPARWAALALALSGFVQAQPRESPPAAVKYIETPLGAPARDLKTDGNARYGVDINSIIDLQISADKLRSALAPRSGDTASTTRAKKLQSRLAHLQSAAGLLKAELEQLQRLIALWEAPDKSSFRAKLKESASRRDSILGALADARLERLKDSGLNEAAARRAAGQAFDAALSGPKMELGYNWDALQQLFREEIEFVRRDLDKAELDFAFRVGVRAQFMPRSGRPAAVFLPGYNEAPTGPRALYEKMQYAASDEQKDLYEQYKEMAKKAGEAKSLGEAVIAALEAEFRQLRAQLDEMAAAAQAARDELQDKLRALEEWGSEEKREAWFKTVEKKLEATAEGRNVAEEWRSLKATFDGMKDDLETLAAYANLRKLLAGKSAPEAMDTILAALDRLRNPRESGLRVLDPGYWTGTAKKIETFAESVEKLAQPLKEELKSAKGPYGDLQAARTAFVRFRDVVRDSAAKAARWVADVIISLRPSRAAAEGVVPPGERPRDVLSGASLNTQIDIPAIPARREIGDRLSVRYEFTQGESTLPGGWTDEFTLQSYGWNSLVLASLAFTKQSGGEATWKPTAAMNWILSKNEWPQPGETGLERSQFKWFSGAGISVMPLESGSTEGVKLGLGATLAFLDNRVLAGVGTNLQATSDRTFIFFSIRLLDFPGLSGPLGGPK